MLRLYLQFTNNNCIFFFIVTSNNFVCSLGTGQMRREDLGNLNCMLIFLGLKDPSESWKLTKLCWKNILWLIDLTLQSFFFPRGDPYKIPTQIRGGVFFFSRVSACFREKNHFDSQSGCHTRHFWPWHRQSLNPKTREIFCEIYRQSLVKTLYKLQVIKFSFY